MISKNSSTGVKLGDQLHKRMMVEIDQMGFKGKSEFIRFAINQAIKKEDDFRQIIERIELHSEDSARKLLPLMQASANAITHFNKRFYEIESSIKQISNILNQLGAPENSPDSDSINKSNITAIPPTRVSNLLETKE